MRASKKVLVIDDEDGIASAIKDYLEEEDYVVTVAGNGQTGLDLAIEEKPDLILLDVGLPDMNGYEVCQKIRAVPELKYTPVIMLTAYTREKDEVTGFSVGADDYVAKPFKPVALLARIQTAIGRNRRELDANSLTHLPGNMSIIQEIEARIATKGPLSVLHFDLNSFKAFNDRYGFVRGDAAIKLTAEILGKSFAGLGTGAFLGHVGGDDFVGVLNFFEAGPVCEGIIKEFDSRIPGLYDEEDRRRRAIVSYDRRGNKVELPIMGLAIAVVTNRQKTFAHPGEIALIAGDLKKWVKSEIRSAYVVDRRT